LEARAQGATPPCSAVRRTPSAPPPALATPQVRTAVIRQTSASAAVWRSQSQEVESRRLLEQRQLELEQRESDLERREQELRRDRQALTAGLEAQFVDAMKQEFIPQLKHIWDRLAAIENRDGLVNSSSATDSLGSIDDACSSILLGKAPARVAGEAKHWEPGLPYEREEAAAGARGSQCTSGEECSTGPPSQESRGSNSPDASTLSTIHVSADVSPQTLDCTSRGAGTSGGETAPMESVGLRVSSGGGTPRYASPEPMSGNSARRVCETAAAKASAAAAAAGCVSPEQPPGWRAYAHQHGDPVAGVTAHSLKGPRSPLPACSASDTPVEFHSHPVAPYADARETPRSPPLGQVGAPCMIHQSLPAPHSADARECETPQSARLKPQDMTPFSGGPCGAAAGAPSRPGSAWLPPGSARAAGVCGAVPRTPARTSRSTAGPPEEDLERMARCLSAGSSLRMPSPPSGLTLSMGSDSSTPQGLRPAYAADAFMSPSPWMVPGSAPAPHSLPWR